jgi:cell division transport system permease protein
MYGVESATFISKEDALAQLKAQMRHQSSLFDNLERNPLPDAFDVRMTPAAQGMDQIEAIAVQMQSLEWVEEVEYGQQWLGRFTEIIKLFKLTGIAVMVVFFLAALFIVGNTIRLVLYSRRDEVEIMRLVGATDRFITAPFYLEGIIQGALGGGIGLFALFITFLLISMNVEQGFSADFFQIRFLPIKISIVIVCVSALVGWMGCFLSIKQYLKT